MRLISYYLVVVFSIFSFNNYAQKKTRAYSTNNEKAIKYYEESRIYFSQYKDKEAEEYIKKPLKKTIILLKPILLMLNY